MNEIDIFLRLAFLGLTSLMFLLSSSAALKTIVNSTAIKR